MALITVSFRRIKRKKDIFTHVSTLLLLLACIAGKIAEDQDSKTRSFEDQLHDIENEHLDEIVDSMYNINSVDPDGSNIDCNNNRVCDSTRTTNDAQHPPATTIEYFDAVETTVEVMKAGSSEEVTGFQLPQCTSNELLNDAGILQCSSVVSLSGLEKNQLGKKIDNDDGLCGHFTRTLTSLDGQEIISHSTTCVDDEDTTFSFSTSPAGDAAEEDTDDEKSRHWKITKRIVRLDKHWGSNERVLQLRDTLRTAGLRGGVHRLTSSTSSKQHEKNTHTNRRPPVFLMPGLAATRLVAWTHKSCPGMVSDIKVQDYVWLNMNKILEIAATIDTDCWKECITLGRNQTDNIAGGGCKLRPDEGLDAISSLAPGSLYTSVLLGGGTNTVYAWLTQWLADNLGYDVTSIIGLPYDWRLSPDVMEGRDGFFTLMRRRIEAAVETNGAPGIMVAHSVRFFRFFLLVHLPHNIYYL